MHFFAVKDCSQQNLVAKASEIKKSCEPQVAKRVPKKKANAKLKRQPKVQGRKKQKRARGKKSTTRCVKRKTKRRKARRAKKAAKQKCYRTGPITVNPYLNFLRIFRRQNCHLPPKQVVQRGARVWQKMDNSERHRFYMQACKVKIERLNEKRRKNKVCAKKRKRKQKCYRRGPILPPTVKTFTVAKPMPKKKANAKLKRQPKVQGRKKQKRARREKSTTRCVKRKTKRRKARRAKKAAKQKCYRKGPITVNPYLNFLRIFRRQNCHLPPKQVVQRGARVWQKMDNSERRRFYLQACRVKVQHWNEKHRRKKAGAARKLRAKRKKICGRAGIKSKKTKVLTKGKPKIKTMPLKKCGKPSKRKGTAHTSQLKRVRFKKCSEPSSRKRRSSNPKSRVSRVKSSGSSPKGFDKVSSRSSGKGSRKSSSKTSRGSSCRSSRSRSRKSSNSSSCRSGSANAFQSGGGSSGSRPCSRGTSNKSRSKSEKC